MNPKNEYLVISQKYMELIYYSNNIIKKYPKTEKFALAQEIKQTLYGGLRSLVFATKSYYKQEKLKHLSELDINLVLLKTLIRLSFKDKYITIKNCFYKYLTFQKLLEAHQRARKNKTYKHEVILFEMNLENNLVNLLNNIKNNRYESGTYRTFKVYEPKERVIKSLLYIDRIVHQWYVEEFLKPFIIPKFINTSFACLEDKGTHRAVETVQKFMRIYKRNHGDFWILKCDISKFFYSIEPNILYNIMKKHINDKALLNFTKKLIFNDPSEELGIPIGNYCSQYFANIYLNELDMFVKHNLHIKYYVRYMDDFILLLNNKQECIKIKKLIEDFLDTNLKLKLNYKSRYYPNKMGVNFCGYRIFETHRLLRLNSKKKIKLNVKRWNKLYNKNLLDLPNTMMRLNSWIAHSSHCNSYKLQNKIYKNCDFLYTNHTYEEIEKEIIDLLSQNSKKGRA